MVVLRVSCGALRIVGDVAQLRTDESFSTLDELSLPLNQTSMVVDINRVQDDGESRVVGCTYPDVSLHGQCAGIIRSGRCSRPLRRLVLQLMR